MHRPTVTYRVPIVQSHAMSTASYTIDTWQCKLANDAHRVMKHISFRGTVLPGLHMWRLYNLLTPMYEVTCMHSTLQMCEVLLLLCYMQTTTQIPWQYVAELKVACCPMLVYITGCIYCIKRMQIKHTLIHGILYAPYITPKPSLVRSIAHVNSPVLYKPPNTSYASQNTLRISTALDSPSHLKTSDLSFPMRPRCYLCLPL